MQHFVVVDTLLLLSFVSSSRNIATKADTAIFSGQSLIIVMWLRSLCFLLVAGGVSAQGFLRDGFNSGMEGDFNREMNVEGKEVVAGMTKEMVLMEKSDWELQPINFNCIKDGPLRRHLQSFMSEPITLKLSNRKGKHGMRAIGQLGSGEKLRAYWRQSGEGNRLKGSDLLEVSYEDACRSRLSTIEFEVQLPPVGKSKKLPSVVYSVPVEQGSMNGKAMIPRGACVVKVFPVGHGQGATPVLDVGKSFVNIPMRAGLVDPGWAKGRSIFRKGRSTGAM
jgi:hypothetical protein